MGNLCYHHQTYSPQKPHIFASRSSTGSPLCIKWTKDKSEVRILRKLLTAERIRYRSHVIDVVNFIDARRGTFIVMPMHQPVNEIKDLDHIDFRLQLIEGVAFLHSLEIAHCDLKPSNLVLEHVKGSHGCLYIIDFGNAVARSCQQMDFHGTEGWTAPEVRDDNEWDPEKADIWAVGNILLALFEDDDQTRDCLLIDPSLRPSAAELHARVAPPTTGRKRVRLVSEGTLGELRNIRKPRQDADPDLPPRNWDKKVPTIHVH